MPPAQAPSRVPDFSIRPIESVGSPSPLVQVQAGSVQAVFPRTWQAVPLPEDRYPQQGFVASSSLDQWEQGAGTVRGMEAFWIDVGREGIPSDYYYLAARATLVGSLATNRHCRSQVRQVLLDRPPDLTGRRFSPSDYVASETGICLTGGHATRWAYFVAAPGFGPIRDIGIPTSGIYVVIAVVSGPRSNSLLKELIDGARFGDASITQIAKLASRLKELK
jgi:hypothetical protein